MTNQSKAHTLRESFSMSRHIFLSIVSPISPSGSPYMGASADSCFFCAIDRSQVNKKVGER